MELEIVRRIRGNVHGTVDVTAVENRVIDHEIVQRLRRVRQLAFLSYVFPGASHSRFEHSLGVMQLAGVTWAKLQVNQRRLAASSQRYRHFATLEREGGLVHGLLAPTFPLIDVLFGSPYPAQVLRLAGLLHDVGHPPFSHSGERFLPSWAKVRENAVKARRYLKEWLDRRCERLVDEGKDPSRTPVGHEVFTVLLVDHLLLDAGVENMGAAAVAARDVVSVIEPEIDPEVGSQLRSHGLHNLLHELVSGEVDVDRMDYLLRDAKECGVVYGMFELSRIQDSLCLYQQPDDGGLHLAITLSGLAAFEDYLRARHSMYLQLYFHKTAVAAEAMLQHAARILGGWTFPADIEAYAAMDEYNVEDSLLTAARHLPPSTTDNAEALIQDLLRRRRLWKRVFELTGKDRLRVRPVVDRACKILDGLGVRYEMVSSSSSLTKFRPRRGNEPSANTLRLVMKDQNQFLRVVPIEDHTSFGEDGERVHISRIYVEDRRDEHGRRLPEVVKDCLTEQLSR